MFHIHQSSTVTDYVDRFSTLFDQLKAYQPDPDMHYYISRFIDGLRDDIRMVVALHKPSTLDSAFSLALLQEDLVSTSHKHDAAKAGFRQYPKAVTPQVRVPGTDKNPGEPTPRKSSDEKLASLRQLRCAKGLCEVCAEKWVRGHKCATNIQLHAMQEVWDALQIEYDTPISDEPLEQLNVLAISPDAQMGSSSHNTMRFSGFIQHIPVVILLDSGSTSSFLSAAVAS